MWGSDALFRRGLALELPTSLIVFVEHAILSLLTFPLVIQALRVRKLFTSWDWMAVVFVGVGASAVATILFTHAFTYGDPATPLLLQKLQPLVAAAGGALLLGERLLRPYFLFLAGGLAGAYLITFEEPTEVSLSAALPALFAVGAAALWGLGTVMGRHLSGKIGFGQLTALRFTVGLPAATAIVVLRGNLSELGAVAGEEWTALLLLALIPGLLALLLYYRGLRRTPAAAATIAELAFPVSAVLINYLAFEESLRGTQWVGIGLISATVTTMGLLKARSARSIGIRVTRPIQIEDSSPVAPGRS